MDTQPSYIAFYGTCRPGTKQFMTLQLGMYLEAVGPCDIIGNIYDMEEPRTNENYPALVTGKGRGLVRAHLFKIRDDSFFPRIDDYEGYMPHDHRNSLYIRKKVTLQNPIVEAWVYEYNQSVAGRKKILGGDWISYKTAKMMRTTSIDENATRERQG